MVAGLSGPKNLLSPAFAGLARAPVIVDVPAPRDGFIVAMDTRAIGLAVIALGGGRLHADDSIDPRVGFSDLRCVGARLQRGESLGRVHARSRADAEGAGERLITALHIDEQSAPRAAPTVLWSSARG
jgi:thymidine phosphorylase